MKKTIFILSMILMSSLSLMAQKQLSAQQKEAFFNSRIQLMQKTLLLTPEQTEQFIPIYKDYIESVHSKMPAKKGKKDTEMNSDEAYNYLMGKLNFNKNIINAQENAIKKLKNILTPQQLLKFMESEANVTKKIRGERQSRRNKGCDLPAIGEKKGKDDVNNRREGAKRKRDIRKGGNPSTTPEAQNAPIPSTI